MRVISGNLKGKIIQNPTDKNTRPLRDMVKESIFNILEHSKNQKIDFKKVLFWIYSLVQVHLALNVYLEE